MQVTKHASKGIHPGFESQDRCHQKSKTGAPEAPQKGPFLKKIFCCIFVFKNNENTSTFTVHRLHAHCFETQLIP